MGLFDNSNNNSLYNQSLLSSTAKDKLGLLALKRDEKVQQLAINTDADSGDNWRLQNVDAPEVYHDNLDERKKVYMQYANLNNTSLEEAQKQVDAEALPYKIARDNGYDLGKQIEDARNKGLLGTDIKPTSYEMYRLGDRATDYVNRESALNPNQGLLNAQQTGTTDVYGRQLVTNDQFANKGLEAGYYVPGATDKTQFDAQTQLVNKAKEMNQGLYDTPTNKTIMDTINATSYANSKVNPQPKYDTSESNLADAVQSSLGTLGANIGDAVADTGLAVTRNLVNSFSDTAKTKNAYNGERDKYVNDTIIESIKGTPLESVIQKSYGQVNFTGLDEAKKSEYYGYQTGEELKQVTKNLSDAYKSGDAVEMGKALFSSLGNPEAIAEVLATSVGEIAAGASVIGTVGLITGKANEIMEARSKITGKPVDELDIGYATGGAVIYGLVNKLTSGMASINTIKESTKALTKNMDEAGLISTLEVIKDISKGTGKAYGIEGGEEVIQDLAVDIATKLGTTKTNEILDAESQANLFTSFGLGGAAGGFTHGIVDTPRKTLEAYQNNAPLNKMNKVAENLSPEEKAKVAEQLNTTLQAREDVINATQANIDLIDSGSNLEDVILNMANIQNQVIESNNNNLELDADMKSQSQQSEQLLTAVNQLTRADAIQESVSSMTEAILKASPNLNTNIDNFLVSTANEEPDTPNLVSNINKALESLNIEPVNSYSEFVSKHATEIPKVLSTMITQGTYESFAPFVGQNKINGTSLAQATSNLINQPEFKGKLKDLLTKSANAITKDSKLVKYKLDQMNNPKHAGRQTRSGLTETFNAKTILDSSILSGVNGISNITNRLQEYDTKTLQELKDSLVNYSGSKNLNKLRTAINDIMHVRGQATKSEKAILGEQQTSTVEPSETNFTTGSDGITIPTNQEASSTVTEVNQTISKEVIDELAQEGLEIKEATVDEVKQRLTIMSQRNIC